MAIRNGLWVVVAVALALFAPTIFFQFAYDDALQITGNPQVAGSSASWSSALGIFKSPTPGNLYRPLATLSYVLTYWCVGLVPWVYHLQNILLHSVNSALVALLAYQILRDRNVAVLSGVLFAVHPIHTEAVANIIGRAELFAAGFGLASLVCFERSLASRDSEHRRFYLASVVFFALAALSKESGFTIVLLVPLLLHRHFAPTLGWPSLRRAALLTLPFLAISGAALACRFVALQSKFFPRGPRDGEVYWENPLFHFSAGERIVPALVTLGDYVRLLLFPFNMSADYSRMPADLFAETYSASGALSVAAVAAFGLSIWAQRRTAWSFFGLWFFLTFLLTSNLITLAPTIMGERLAYLPSAGFVVFLCASFGAVLRPKWFTPAIVLIALAYSVRTAIRLPVWYSTETVFHQTALDAPQSPKAIYNQALLLFEDKKDYEAARAGFKRVLGMFPNHLLSLMCLADIAMEQKRFEEMASRYRQILTIDPGQQKIRQELERYEAWRASQPAAPAQQ